MEEKFRILSCGRYQSFFRLMNEFWLTPNQRHVAHRMCTMMRKMGAEAVVIEEVFDCSGIRSEEEAIKRRLAGNVVTFKNYKVTFLDVERNDDIAQMYQGCTTGRALGYFVVVNILSGANPIRSYVYEGVVRELGCKETGGVSDSWKALDGHYLHVKRDFTCKLHGEPYTINGTFFAQQNGITSVCAHACLVMMLNNAPLKKLTVTAEDINAYLGINHVTRKIHVEIPGLAVDNRNATHVGLNAEEIKLVVEKKYEYRFYPKQFTGLQKPKFREFLYGFIESGFPALLCFKTGSREHVVAVAGHTLNPNSWLPLAIRAYTSNGNQKYAKHNENRCLSSLTWVNDFIVHDDNVGMQLSLPAHAFHDIDDYSEGLSNFSPSFAAGIFPVSNNIEILAHQAEHAAAEYLNYIVKKVPSHPIHSGNYYLQHLLEHFHPKRRTVVLRTSLVSAEMYIEHLRNGDNHENFILGSTMELIEQRLLNRRHFWLVEVTEPDLYVGNTAKVVDVLIDPSFTAPSAEKEKEAGAWFMSICALKLPELLMIRQSQTSRFEAIELQTKVHCSLFSISTEGKAVIPKVARPLDVGLRERRVSILQRLWRSLHFVRNWK